MCYRYPTHHLQAIDNLSPMPNREAQDDAFYQQRFRSRKLALMQRLPSELKLRVATREISLEDAMREAGIVPGDADG